ncbi:MAG: LLM class flavin-dependent oxidoreductase [Bacteroidales bacterium]|nr:LLM class flavin-dependent oxidoreductase [Bacteroidales bacterium]
MTKIRTVGYASHSFLPPSLTGGAMPGHLTATGLADDTPSSARPARGPFEISTASIVGAEKAGYDGVLCADATQSHMPTAAWSTEFSDLMEGCPDPNSAFTMEPVITASAPLTSAIEYIWGPVDCVRRAPINIAQMLLTLDHATRGRVSIVLAHGQQNHMRQTGIPRAGTRDKFWDGVQIVKKLTTQSEAFSYRGRVWKFDRGALALPPYNPESPPGVLIAGGSPESLELCGRFSDGWLDGPPTLDEDDPAVFAHKVAEIRRHARDAGRDPDSLRIMVQMPVILADDPAVIDELVDHPYVKWSCLLGASSQVFRKWGIAHPYDSTGAMNYNYFKDIIPEWVSREEFIDVTRRMPREAVYRCHFVGTPETVMDRIEPYLAQGITDVMTFNPGMLAGSKYLASCGRASDRFTQLLRERDVRYPSP